MKKVAVSGFRQGAVHLVVLGADYFGGDVLNSLKYLFSAQWVPSLPKLFSRQEVKKVSSLN